MKKKFTLLLSLLGMFSLLSCSSGKHYESRDYVLNYSISHSTDFRILQLSDTHLGNKDNQDYQFNFLDNIIKKANPDMIIVTGDLFTFGDRATAKRFFSFFDSYKLPWTVTFGNHDEQCYFSIDWLTGYLNSLTNSKDSYCLFKDLQDDDVFGNCNFVINLNDSETGNPFYQIFCIDSNRYDFGKNSGYDSIKDNQIQWYKDMVDYGSSINGGVTLPSLAFFHIPFAEFEDAWEAYQQGSPDAKYIHGTMGESTSDPVVNTGLFDVMLEKGSTKGVFVGHDHVNDYAIVYKGILLSYCLTSTDRIYFDENKLGGKVITIKRDNSLGIEEIFVPYKEA